MDRPRRGRSDDNAAVIKETEEEKAPDDNNNNNMEVEATTPAPTPTPKQEIGDEQAPKIDEALSPNAAPASGPAHRDICFGEGSEEHRASLLLRDLIALHILLWKLSGKAMPTAEKDVEGLTERLFQLTKKGKGRDLAGLKDVPRPFLVKNGRFLVKEDGDWKELSDEEARAKLKSLIFTSFKAAETENEDEETENLKTLKKELREYLAAHEKDTESVVDHDSVKPTDVILLQRTEGEGDKAYDNQGGNKVMFMLASQYVNAESASPSKRLEAALSVFLSKGTTAQAQTAAASPPTPAAAATTIAGDGNGEGDKDKPAEEKPTEEKVEPRFIFCKSKGDGQRELSLVKPVDAAEVTLLFVFEVWLEKEIAGKTGASAASVAEAGASEMQPPGTEAIDTPTPHDVLFGRGGMTNRYVMCGHDDLVLPLFLNGFIII